jgi:FMN hydrolase / 5-amino-6-(5-phospho-D-ribitylamino)uracil phosphatase
VVLFDAMDTLVRDPAYHELPAHFGLEADELFRELQPGLWDSFERGQLAEEDYFRRLFLDGRPVEGEAMKAALFAGYRWLPGMRELLSQLGEAGAEMHILSNYPCWYRELDARLGLSRFLPWSFVSCQTGVRKPEPEAYLGALRELGRRPAECLFVDDRLRNVEAARACGLNGHHFGRAETLRAELVELALLGPEPGSGGALSVRK